MKDIKCPSCGKTFRIDPSSFEEILLQIKDEEFNKQIKERLILAEEDNKKALEILKRELKIQLIEQNRIKESEIQTLESKLKIAEEKKTNALNDLKNQATNKINSCETQFNLNRASAFKNSYFEKDNDATSGSKGDYIFREFDENKTEVVSIMFEMKNESLNGTNKRKNEDFLKELDKDRRQKSCEYAVLVSLLEPDSELYNAGIVDVSHRFPKMYVIRPQFFLPIISLLRNASMETLKYKSQIDLMKRENFDITNFESTLEQFKNAVGKNVSLAQDRFNDAISEIDKSITHLQKTKEALVLSKKHLLSADSKSQDLTVKKLTRNNPTMKKKFNDLNNFEDEVA